VRKVNFSPKKQTFFTLDVSDPANYNYLNNENIDLPDSALFLRRRSAQTGWPFPDCVATPQCVTAADRARTPHHQEEGPT
jgi:hypothetical protein